MLWSDVLGDRNHESKYADGSSGPTYDRLSRADGVYAELKKGILAGRWRPGERINDQEIAVQFGVSRASVREALTKFVENRVVERVHWKGFYVRNITLEEIESIIEVRVALEELSLRHLMDRWTQEMVDQLKFAIEDSERALHTGSHDEYLDKDFEFHELIYRYSGIEWVRIIISNLNVVINLARDLSMRKDFYEAAKASIHDHRDMLFYVQNKDLSGLLSSFRRHMDTHLQNMREEFIREGCESDGS